MASSTPEQLFTAPRAAKVREILFEAIANGSVESWRHINLDGNMISTKVSSRIRFESSPNIGGISQSDFGSSEKRYLVVYIRVVVNRVASYVPLLEEPPAYRSGRNDGSNALTAC